MYSTEIRHFAKNPQGALFQELANDIKIYIGGSIEDKDAYLFYLNQNDQVVGNHLRKYLFGWKLKSSHTGSGLDVSVKQILSQYNTGPREDKSKFYFGLTSIEHARKMIIDGEYDAILIPLDEHLPKNVTARSKYLWYAYFEDHTPESHDGIEVFDEFNNLIYQSS